VVFDSPFRFWSIIASRQRGGESVLAILEPCNAGTLRSQCLLFFSDVFLAIPVVMCIGLLNPELQDLRFLKCL
jgi:hypothetical protein